MHESIRELTTGQQRLAGIMNTMSLNYTYSEYRHRWLVGAYEVWIYSKGVKVRQVTKGGKRCRPIEVAHFHPEVPSLALSRAINVILKEEVVT